MIDNGRSDNRRIEEASSRAWPAREQQLIDGWVVRITDGYTRRANSVTPLYPSQMPPGPKITRCEQLYAARELPCCFRLTTAAPAPDLDRLLEDRGYRAIAPTAVLTRDLSAADSEASAADPPVRSLTEWLAVFSRLQDAAAINHEKHRRILSAVAVEMRMTTRGASGREVACGMGVVDGELLGIFDILTDPRERRRGHAWHLATDLLAWGQRRGARQAYLQVVRENVPALRLYEKLGFREAYGYWYRLSAGNRR